ncbi:MAG: AAA family ATPase [Actinomycetota bacterium]
MGAPDKVEVPTSPGPITVLITDIEGSTAYTATRGDEVAMDLIRVHERLVRGIVAGHQGREIKSMGDGFMLAFAESATAIACGLDIQRALEEHNDAHPDHILRVRMGVNTGPVIEEGGDIYGTTVNAASRIAAKARSGQLLLSEETKAAADEGDWAFVDRGLFWLKGLKERWRLYEATRNPDARLEPALAQGRTPFVDRDEERAAMRQSVDAALDGHGSLLLLAGDTGTGKTRLAEEIGAEAEGRGMRFCVGRCYEASRADAFSPFIAVLEAIERESTPRDFRVLLGESAGEIARLLPHLRHRYPDIPAPADLPADQERRYLFMSLRDVLAAAARERPLFVLLDDLHWADEPSLRFIEQMAAGLAVLPILMVATCTQEGLSETRPFQRTVEHLHRHRLIERFAIGPLGEKDVRTLLEAIGKTRPPDDLVRVLYRETEGNVFFVEEVVRHLSEQGLLFYDVGEWRMDVGTIDLDVPDSVRLTIGRRLDGLADTTRRVLTLAALVGRAFGFDLLESVADATEDELLDALDEAEHSHLIRSTSESGLVQFRFSHELTRQVLAKDVSLTRRQIMHLRIADAMEEVYADSLNERAADISFHLVEAGRRAETARTVRFLVMAGRRSIESAAYEDAVRHLDRALSFISSDDPAARGPVLEQLGLAERSLGIPDDAISTWREALDAYEAADDTDAVAALCLKAGIEVAWWLRRGEMEEFVNRGLAALGDRRTAERAGLLAVSGAHASQIGEYERAGSLLTEGLGLAREHDNERILGLALYSSAAHHFNYDEYDRAAERGMESVDLLRRAGDLWNLANVLGYVAASHSWRWLFKEAAEYGTEAEALALKLGNWSAWVWGQRARTFQDFLTTLDFEWYEEDGRRAVELGQQQNFDWVTALGYMRIGLAEFWLGRWSDSLKHFKLATDLNIRGAHGGYVSRMFLAHAYLGNRQESLELIDSVRSDFAVAGRANRGTGWLLALGAIEALALIGERSDAAALYQVAVESMHGGRKSRGMDHRLLHTLAGIAASCGDDWDVAEDHFREAIRLAHEVPYLIEEADAKRFYAQMLIDRGKDEDRASTRTLLEEAIASYRSIRMPGHERLATEMLDQIA